MVWVLVAVTLRVGVVPPEQCTTATRSDLSAAIERSVAWLVDNQNTDGTWLYRYDRKTDTDLGGYNLARHGGLLASLYQSHRAGFRDALEAGDNGAAYVLTKLVEADGGLSFGEVGREQRLGGTALALAGFVERRWATGDDRYDREMEAMATFLAAQVAPNGSVLGAWDPVTEEGVPGSYSKFFTGEVLWALAAMHRLFPEAGYGAAAQRTMDYVATDRHDAEGWWPPIPDHWAAYAMAEMVQWPDADGVTLGVTDDVRAYAVDQAELQSVQIRYESQRTNSLVSYVTRGRQTLGAGLGTIGEALGALSRLQALDPALDIDRDALAERTSCTMGVLVDRQVDDAEAETYADPVRTRGAWFQFEITQMDDQQHSLSALVAGYNLLEETR